MRRQLKSGMKVRVKRFKHPPVHWNSEGGMDYLMGRVVTIYEIDTWIKIKEDRRWVWMESDFVANTKNNYY